MKKVIIASLNPVKIKAVKLGFEKMFPKENFEFEGSPIPSGIDDQPKTDLDTMKGARNRAENAKINHKEGDFWVGIEGGIEKNHEGMECFAWIVVKSKDKEGKAKTSTFFLPQKLIDLIEQGKELGDADDIVFGRTNSKQENGSVGILTDNLIDRTKYYEDAVVLSLIPFKNSHLY